MSPGENGQSDIDAVARRRQPGHARDQTRQSVSPVAHAERARGLAASALTVELPERFAQFAPGRAEDLRK